MLLQRRAGGERAAESGAASCDGIGGFAGRDENTAAAIAVAAILGLVAVAILDPAAVALTVALMGMGVGIREVVVYCLRKTMTSKILTPTMDLLSMDLSSAKETLVCMLASFSI